MKNKTYQFEYKDMAFSKDGQLDELIALDRYAVQTYDDYRVGDTVVAIIDAISGMKRIGVITGVVSEEEYQIQDRFGEIHTVTKELLQKPLETRPAQLWERWAKGAASVETSAEKKEFWENEFRWLFDGYRYSLGGRIQLMLGQEYVTGEKANLTAYNCYVIKSARGKDTPLKQFLEVIETAEYEGNIMRRGGGVGTNISLINRVNGSGRNPKFFQFVLPATHKDAEELKDRQLLGKFEGVTVLTESLPETEGVNVIRVGDSVEELYAAMKDMTKAAYNQAVKQVVVDFSDIRHRNAIVKGVNGRSSGAVSWMELFVLIAQLLQQKQVDNVDFAEIFSQIVHLIIQGGSRRGALMLICEDDNPNIEKFITRKTKAGYLTGANISVGVSDAFMERVEKAKAGSTKKADIEALRIWDLLIVSAWSSAEPGIVWLERYNKMSNSNYYEGGILVATNPCGEQGLPEWSVCNLGHFVLSRFYNEQTNDVNWDELARACVAAVRLQDNIIDYTPYFLEENKQQQLRERRVGIGSMGLGTLMIKLGLRYGSDEGNEFVDKLYKFIAYQQYKASMDIAGEKGAFPAYEYEGFSQSGFMQRLLGEFPELDELLQKNGIRNVTINTQAPTGSTGTYIDNIPSFREKFGGTTTGIEPYFSWEYWRAGRLGMAKQTVDLALDYMKKHDIKDVKDLPPHFVTAMDLAPVDHVRVQAAVQKWTDSSISKTANCPSDYTIEQTDELYRLSYQLGLKGMTIYRDGSRDSQVLAVNEEDAKLESHMEAQQLKDLKEKQQVAATKTTTSKKENSTTFVFQKRPKRLYGFTEKVGFTYGDKFGKAYVTVNLKDGEPWEVFVQTKVKEASSLAKALGLMTTKLLRLGAADNNLEQVIDTLSYDQTMGTLPAGIANILRGLEKEPMAIVPVKVNSDEATQLAQVNEELKGLVKQFAQKSDDESQFRICPDCGEKAFDKPNCICHACGSSKCN